MSVTEAAISLWGLLIANITAGSTPAIAFTGLVFPVFGKPVWSCL